MKKMKMAAALLLIFALACMAVVPVFATTYYYSSGYELYHDSNGSDWVINSCSLDDNEISLPEHLLSGNVTAVGGFAFQNRSAMTYVYVPDTIISIGTYAFDGCTSLSEVVIGENLRNIYVGAFRNCDALTTLNLSNTKLSLIANAAFYDCDSLQEVMLPDTLESIGANAFANCPSLNKIVIGRNVTKIAASAFNNSPNLVLEVYTDTAGHQYAVNNRIDHMVLDRQSGDVNFDGSVDILDSTEIQKYAAEKMEFTPEQFEMGDINKDGFVDVVDALLVQKHVIGSYDIPPIIVRY